MRRFCLFTIFILIHYFSSAQLESIYKLEETGFTDSSSVYFDSLAKADARVNYINYRHAATGSFFSGVFAFTGIGIVPAAIMYATKPKERNLGYPNQTLFGNTQYAQSYLREAKKIKRRKVAKNFAFGVLLAIPIFTFGEAAL